MCPVSGDAVQALSEQPRSGISGGCHPALGPRPLLATLGNKLLDLSREHCLRWSCGSLCVCKSSFGLDRTCEQARGSHQDSVKVNSGECCRPVSPPVRALPAPWGPAREDGGGARLPLFRPHLWPELIQSPPLFLGLEGRLGREASPVDGLRPAAATMSPRVWTVVLAARVQPLQMWAGESGASPLEAAGPPALSPTPHISESLSQDAQESLVVLPGSHMAIPGFQPAARCGSLGRDQETPRAAPRPPALELKRNTSRGLRPQKEAFALER